MGYMGSKCRYVIMDNQYFIKLYKEIKNTIKGNLNELPSSCYFLKNHNVLALRNTEGVSRHPYSKDGLTLWTYSEGRISLIETNFSIFPSVLEGKEPYINFYGGLFNKDHYDYFSINGAMDTLLGEKIEKYVVFTPTKAIYLRVYKNVLYAVTLSINENKYPIITSKIINLSSKEVEVYLSSYLNPMLTHYNAESEETKWFRRATLTKDGALIYSVEDVSREIHLHNYALIKRDTNGEVSSTSSRMLYIGNKTSPLNVSTCLLEGRFKEEKKVSQFIDSACYGDIIKKKLKKGESLDAAYKISLYFGENASINIDEPFSYLDNENDFIKLDKEYHRRFISNPHKLEISLKLNEDSTIKEETFNRFIEKVIEQVDYCARSKNSSPLMLGVRDVAQMLEASLIWDPKGAREKILYVLERIDESGRVPRQIGSFDELGQIILDTREFIDQGQWIFNFMHKYLTYTSDYSLLNEKIGYIKIVDVRLGIKTKTIDTVYDHLVRIMNYLIDKIDPTTGCLRTLFGDWNDAIDGLGMSKDGSKEFGSGVSVMATYHLYMNLNEFIEIVRYKGDDPTKYIIALEELSKNIKNTIVNNGDEYRIVHGWGDERSFYVGSFKDVDGLSRHSSTSNSFYVISRYYEKDPSMKETILHAYDALEGKYGLLTFDKPFDPKNASAVGRVVNLPFGTAENGATYIHAGMYAVRALGLMDEGERAYKELLKLIPITHEKISTSPFVMPNSYGYNLNLGINGESMSDWYTGSSNTLIKTFVSGVIDINPLHGNKVIINPHYFPVKAMDIRINIKNRIFKLHYENNGNRHPKIYYQNKEISNLIDLDIIKDKTINLTIL